MGAVLLFVLLASACQPILVGPPTPSPTPTATPYPTPTYNTPPCAQARLLYCNNVIDGDTINVTGAEALNGSERIRLIGVDTPETYPTVECYGPEASQHTRQLAEGQDVWLCPDAEATDYYGRTLSYVYVGQLFLNLDLVARGYARTLTIAPNTAHQADFAAAQQAAQQGSLGLWGACF